MVKNSITDKGGLLVGQTDKDGHKGITVLAPEGNIRMGGGEIIINEESSRKYCEELSKINQAGGGVAIPCDKQKIANTTDNPGAMENGGQLNAKKIKIPLSKLISYNWKLDEVAENLSNGKTSYSPDEPATVTYVPDKKKYLIMDGHHRILQKKQAGEKTIEAYINPYVPKFYNLGDYPTSVISEYKLKYDTGGKTELSQGVKIEREHENLYNELKSRLENEGNKMPMSKPEFFETIAKAHLAEKNDYYTLLKKYIEKSSGGTIEPNKKHTINNTEYMEDKTVDLKSKTQSHEHKNILNSSTLSWVKTIDGRHFYKVFEGDKTHEDVYNHYKDKGISVTHTDILVIHNTAKKRDLSAFIKYMKKLAMDEFQQNINPDSLMIEYIDNGDAGFVVKDTDFELADGSKVHYDSKEHTLTKMLSSGGKLEKSIFVRDTLIDKNIFNELPAEKQVKIKSLIGEFKKLGYLDVRTELGPDQIARMSAKQKEKISNDALEAFRIESEIKELLKSEEQLSKEEREDRIKYLQGRLSQLNRRISDLETIGFLKKKIESPRANATKTHYLEEKAAREEVEKELSSLKSMSGGGITRDRGYVAQGTMQTKDGEITGVVRHNELFNEYQVIIDGSMYGTHKNEKDAIDELERSGFKNVVRIKAEGGKTGLRHARILYDNGEIRNTSINGSDETIKDYFKIGKSFNLGRGEHDNMAKVIEVQLDPPSEGDLVIYKDVNGEFTLKALVEDIFSQDGVILFKVGDASYTLDEIQPVTKASGGQTQDENIIASLNKGGKITKDNLSELAGRKIKVSYLDAQEPETLEIENVTLSDDKSDNREIIVDLTLGTRDKFPFEKLDDFLSGKDVEIKDAEGNKGFIKLLSDTYKINTFEKNNYMNLNGIFIFRGDMAPFTIISSVKKPNHIEVIGQLVNGTLEQTFSFTERQINNLKAGKKVKGIEFIKPKSMASGGKTKGAIGMSGKKYGYDLKAFEKNYKSQNLFVSPDEYWKSQLGSKYTDSFGRKQIVTERDKENIMHSYAYKIMIALDLGSKLVPSTAKEYAEKIYSKEDFANPGVRAKGGQINDETMPSGGKTEKFVAVGIKNGYWTVISRPGTKQQAESQLELGGLPSDEKGEVKTVEEVAAHNKVVGKEYLTMARGGKTHHPKDLPKDGSDIKIHMPKLGNFPAKDIILKYDQKNFKFNIFSDGKKVGAIGEREVLSNLDNGMYEFEDNKAMASGGKIKEYPLPNTNLYLYGRGMDVNGNSIVKIGFPNQKAFSIQTNGTLPDTHRIMKIAHNELSEDELLVIEKEVADYISEYGSKAQKLKLKKYKNFGKWQDGTPIPDSMASGGSVKSMCPKDSHIITLIFDKPAFSQKKSIEWAKKHDFKANYYVSDQTETTHRIRQQKQNKFKPTSLRTIELTDGVKALIGCLRGNATLSK